MEFNYIDKVIEEYIRLAVKKDETAAKVDYLKMMLEHHKTNDDKKSEYMEQLKRAKEDLLVAKQKLSIQEQKFANVASSLNQSQLSEAVRVVEAKHNEGRDYINKLNQMRAQAKQNGDKAFSENNFDEETFWNNTSFNCIREIEKVEPKLRYYNYFARELKKRSIEKESSGIARQKK